jgi:hypothetical protein
MPSGILSEQMAVNSVAQTLAANVPGLSRLKILIHGQEVDTLAGHVDLTGFFDLASLVQAPSATQPSPPAAAPLATAPSGSSGAPKAGTAGGVPATHLID